MTKNKMRATRLVFGFCLFRLTASMSFAQNQQWVYPPNNINMNGNAPVVTTIPGATAGTNNISNGAYDQNGKLLFYVKDLKVYTSTSVLKGKLPMPGPSGTGNSWLWEGAEIEIVPVPGSGFCNKFYVIYTVYEPAQTQGCLLYETIDCSSGSPVAIGPAFNSTLMSTYYSQNVLEWLYFDAQGLAVSKLTSNNTKRYLFTVGFKGSPNLSIRNQINYGGLLRWTIDASGIHSPIVGSDYSTLIAADDTDLGNYYQYYTWRTVCQMSLSDDQTRLAWGGATQTYNNAQSVFEVKLNSANYSYVPGSFHQYHIPYNGSMFGSTFVAGVEYAANSNNKLYASMRDCIYYIPAYLSSPALIPGSTSLTQQPLSSMSGSQLQYVKSTGRIVGVRVTNTAANTGTLFSIDPSNNSIASISSNALSSWDFVTNYSGRGFTLPDQVDVNPVNCSALMTSDFAYQTNYTSPNTYFTVSATPLTPYSNCAAGIGDLWVVVQLDSSGNPIPGTDTSTGTSSNPTCWWIYPAANTFPGFDGTKGSGINNVTCPNPSPGRFLNAATYRITHGIWNSYCPWSQTSHTVSVTGHRITEKNKSQGNVPDYRYLKP